MNVLYYKKRKIPICLFDKSCIKCHIQHEESSLRSIVIEQVNYNLTSNATFRFNFLKKMCSHTCKASLEEVTVMHSEKIKAKHIMKDV